MFGQGQRSSPQMVTVRYHEKKGSQQRRKAPMTMPRVTNALCSFRQLVWMRWRSRSPGLSGGREEVSACKYGFEEGEGGEGGVTS